MASDDQEQRFRDFVVARWHTLTRMAHLLTGDHGRAEDLVQTALEKTHKHWRRIERSDQPEVYVRRVMVNQAISWSRRRRLLELPLLTAHAPVVDPYAQHDLHEALWQALATLPPRMRAVLVLRFYEELTEAETAAALACSVGSVKSQTSRGLARLRHLLGDEPAHAANFTEARPEGFPR